LHIVSDHLLLTHHFTRLKPRRPPSSTLFPYTTLFRSQICSAQTPTPSWWRACPARWRSARRHRPPSCSTPPPMRPCRLKTASCRSEEHTSELQSHLNLVCRLLLEKKNKNM